MILVASYVFYGLWDWRFFSLILFSTLLIIMLESYYQMKFMTIKRKVLLWISVVFNVGFLGFFKYYNFFIDSCVAAVSLFGSNKCKLTYMILPVGISFYTFQTLRYSFDVYYKKLKPTKDFLKFSAFVSFFPQLIAGPIERASNSLPQFYIKTNI